MQQNHPLRFFAYLSFYAVHSPIQTTEKKWQKYRDKAHKQGVEPSAYKMGKFLRKYRVDEFPQFINVLLGSMSIVGPRPERQEFLDDIIREIPQYSELQCIKPGITSLGQIA